MTFDLFRLLFDYYSLRSIENSFESLRRNGSNAVSSRLSGLKRLGNFFVFPLMTNAVFERLNCTHKNGQEEKEESKKQDKSGF